MRQFPSTEARSRIAEQFGLEWDISMQDWEVEVSDSSRVPEFASGLRSVEDSDQRLVLLELTLASLDDLIEETESGSPTVTSAWEDIRDVVAATFLSYPGVWKYWSAGFAVSRFVRELK